MDSALTEDQLKALLTKEWLVKVDAQTSTPYLFKFFFSRMDLSCGLLITDTKTVYTEVLNARQFARRWRACNPSAPQMHDDDEEEDAWREIGLEILADIHTIGVINDISFEVTQSKLSDFAIELDGNDFNWRWETNSAGYRASAEIISKHLVYPLISANHLALSSPDPLGEMADNDVEKAVDKVARTARRAADTHVKNVFSKPKFATMLRRITAMFNFAADLPSVSSVAQRPELDSRLAKHHHHVQKPLPLPQLARLPSPPAAPARTSSPRPDTTKTPISQAKPHLDSLPPPVQRDLSPPLRSEEKLRAMQSDSATEDESESEDENARTKERVQAVTSPTTAAGDRDVPMRSPSVSPPPEAPSPGPRRTAETRASPSPMTKAKKPRLDSSSDDSDAAGNSKGRASTSRVPVKRGAKQPVKRGGKRF